MSVTTTSDLHYTAVLAFTFMFANGIHAGNCDGAIKNQKIIGQPPHSFYVGEGEDVLLKWTYCKTKPSAITGMIVFRISADSAVKKTSLLSMDTKGNVYKYSRNRNFVTRIALRKTNSTITFVIKYVVVEDSGFYSLEIRREGYPDLRNMVQIRVRKSVSKRKSTVFYPTLVYITPKTWSSIKPTTKSLNKSVSTVSKRKSTVFYPTLVYITPKTRSSIKPTTKSLNKSVSTGINVEESEKGTKEYKRTFIVLISLTAGVVPFALFFIVFAIFKLCKYHRKKRKRIKSDQSGRSNRQQTTPINVERHLETSGSWEINTLSTMSGFSYRDSVQNYDTDDFPSSVTFGIPSTNRETHTVAPVYQPSTKVYIRQDPECPFLPKRKSYEIKRELIQNLRIIGQGAFGLVAKADLLVEAEEEFGKCTVAVKMLKEYALNEDRLDLISEFNLMRQIDTHPNVVELLGCVMISEPIWVITEYVARGDLLGFLRKSRGINDTTYHDLTDSQRTSLSQEQLLRMARDIACGMMHLSQNKIIHRDLAARNILVDKTIKCKITDFGMARDVKSTNYYRTRNRGRIPLKWTALEALLNDKYTTKSDVWSYGVVLYEIVTIGGSPYSTLVPREILRRLKRGWRMEKPRHVNDELYNIMQVCWDLNPDDRPSFSDLSQMFSKLLGGGHEYINMKKYTEVLCRNIASASAELCSSESGNEVAV